MAQRPTAGYNFHFDGTASTDIVGALLEHDKTSEGDTEDVSGTGDTVGGVVRRKGKPVDKGVQVTFTLILDDAATGYAAFLTAMENRTTDTDIYVLNEALAGFKYTGHSESFGETLSRGESVWKANLTFFVNAEAVITGGS